MKHTFNKLKNTLFKIFESKEPEIEGLTDREIEQLDWRSNDRISEHINEQRLKFYHSYPFMF